MSATDAAVLLAALAQRLREAELAPDVRELADAVWLARHLGGDAGRGAVAEERTRLPAGVSGGVDDSPGPVPALSGDTSAAADPERFDEPVLGRLFAPAAADDGAHDMRTAAVRVPAAPALADPLGLQRGLRPLQRYRAPVRAVARQLDERATAELAAESGGLLNPVLRPRRRREARLLLLMDMSTSTVVWRQALDELRYACERAGSFRDVQVQFLYADAGGRPGYAPPGGGTARLSDPRQLADPTGHRLILLLSDCAGPMWRSGHIQQLLYGWAQSAPVAVVQPLAQRMWQRTHLPARRGVLHRREGPVGRLEFSPERGPGAHGRLPVPVLALRRSSVEGWARLMSAATGHSLPAAAGWVSAVHPASDSPVRAKQDSTGEERVRAFLRQASPAARQLAVVLSTVPLYLPVMRLAQRAMFADSGPEVLAEVLLSGLIRRQDDAADPDAVRYGFLPDVASALRSRLDPQDAQLLLKHCSDYVERHFGRTARNFPALAAAVLHGRVPAPGAELVSDPDPQAGRTEPPGLRAFAEVSMELLRDLAPGVGVLGAAEIGGGVPVGWEEVVDEGEQALHAYLEEGRVRELDRAVRLLEEAERSAVGAEQERRAGESLGRALYQRWHARGAPEDLSRAHRVLSAVPDRTWSGRAALGVVLSELAVSLNGRRIRLELLPADVRDWAQRAATDDRPPEVWAFVECLRRCAAELSAVSDNAPETSIGQETRAALTLLLSRTYTLLAWQFELAEPQGYCAAESRQDWFLDHLTRSIEALGPVLQHGEVNGYLARAETHRQLALLYADEFTLSEGVDPEAVGRHAEAAVEDYLAVVNALGEEPGEVLCRARLGLARVRELRGDPPGEVVADLDRAVEAAGDELELRRDCLYLVGEASRRFYDEDADREALDRAATAFEQVLELLDADDQRRTEAVQHHGEVLLMRAMLDLRTGSPRLTDLHGAVEALRESVDSTSADAAELPYLRMVLGQACLVRYQAEGVVTDLHEADWILGEAARGIDDPTELAHCWDLRADAATGLFDRTGNRAQLTAALRHEDRAVAAAHDAESDDLVAQLLGHRAVLLSRLERRHDSETDLREALTRAHDPELRMRLEADLMRLRPEANPGP